MRRSSRIEKDKDTHSAHITSYNTKDSTSSYETRTLSSGPTNAEVFHRYCNISKLPVDERKFCYDTDSIRKEIYRLMDLGATEDRICRKVHKINPDFCKTVAATNEAENAVVRTEKQRERGVIYE